MLNLQDGYVQYVNAGHKPPYMIKSDGELVTLESGGPILGMFSDVIYKTGSVHLNDGDSLALFTDGIVETFNEEEEEFSDERLIDILKREKNKPLETVIDTILGELKEFCGASPLGDDITLLLIKKQ